MYRSINHLSSFFSLLYNCVLWVMTDFCFMSLSQSCTVHLSRKILLIVAVLRAYCYCVNLSVVVYLDCLSRNF
jgi:hypothetical protein